MKKLMTVVLAAVVTVSLVFGMVSCGGGGSPTAAAKAFYAAVEKGDYNAMAKVATPETVSLMAMFGEMAKAAMAELGKITNTSEKIDGDTATVTFTYANGETEDTTLKKIDGKWLVNISK